ncbi:MAG TPA: MBL fold metallo-hydrolase, partial [Parafilimonas sp.]|nr:MBL fold metallo-hydrolase [Parafilimonas sp.]
MKKVSFLTGWFVCICFQLSAQTFQSKHFTIQKLAHGVYAAIATNGGYAICNAGIVDLGDATLIFDPFMTPEAADDLKKAAEQLTGHAVKYVVNSHFHNDHIGGDQVFTGAALISTTRTRELIAEYQPQEIEDDKLNASASLEKTRNEDTSTMTPHQREEHTMWTGYYAALATSSNFLKIILPDITFTDSLTIHGSNIT